MVPSWGPCHQGNGAGSHPEIKRKWLCWIRTDMHDYPNSLLPEWSRASWHHWMFATLSQVALAAANTRVFQWLKSNTWLMSLPFPSFLGIRGINVSYIELFRTDLEWQRSNLTYQRLFWAKATLCLWSCRTEPQEETVKSRRVKD